VASSANTRKRSTSTSSRSGSSRRASSSGAKGTRSTPSTAKRAKGGTGGAGGGRRTDADRGVLRGHLGARRVEIGGLALVVLGVVAGLGTYADAAGPVGEFLEAIALGLLGLVGYVVPVVVTWFGLLVVIGRPGPEVGRIAVGAVLSLVGVLGGLHLLADAPDPERRDPHPVAGRWAARMGHRNAAHLGVVGVGGGRGAARRAAARLPGHHRHALQSRPRAAARGGDPASRPCPARGVPVEAARPGESPIEAQTVALQETFDQFGIDATVARWSRGPTVTRFEIELGPGVQVKKVANMGDDIAYALAAPDVRIVAPIPGKSAIGVEVPNRQRDLITLGDILRSDEAPVDPHPLTVALGVDIAGKTRRWSTSPPCRTCSSPARPGRASR
jgi:hypothetical protein